MYMVEENKAEEVQSKSIVFSRVLISGAGFLADAYDLFVINIAVDLMERCNYTETLTTSTKTTLKSMAVAGAIVGQIGFGSIADLIGRKRVFIATCSLVIIGAVLSGLVVHHDGKVFDIYTQVSFWRFILGVGVGGEYPLSAAITTESSSSGHEIPNLALVFSMQGIGTLLCSTTLVIITSTMGEQYEYQWRLALLLGAAPMVIAFYFRWRMHETEWRREGRARVQIMELQYGQNLPLDSPTDTTIAETAAAAVLVEKATQERTVTLATEQSEEDLAQLSTQLPSPDAHTCDTPRSSIHRRIASVSDSNTEEPPCLEVLQHSILHFQKGYKAVVHTVRLNYWNLLGTAGAWFLLDIVFYGNGLFSGQVTKSMRFAQSPRSEAVASLFLQSIALPGYFCSVLFAQVIGLRRLQLYGFTASASIFLILAVFQPLLVQVSTLYVLFYGFTFFAQNFGPNATTYIVPSLLFAAEHRGTCHGISAAAGKLGALLGAQVFLHVVNSFCAAETCTSSSPPGDINAGLQLTFLTCSAVCIAGWCWTYFLVPDPVPCNRRGVYENIHGAEPIHVTRNPDRVYGPQLQLQQHQQVEAQQQWSQQQSLPDLHRNPLFAISCYHNSPQPAFTVEEGGGAEQAVFNPLFYSADSV